MTGLVYAVRRPRLVRTPRLLRVVVLSVRRIALIAVSVVALLLASGALATAADAAHIS
jgi:hypothetical protein